MRRNPTTSTQRAQRQRRHQKLLLELIEKAQADAFKAWIAVLVRENPNGDSLAAGLKFQQAWLAKGYRETNS